MVRGKLRTVPSDALRVMAEALEEREDFAAAQQIWDELEWRDNDDPTSRIPSARRDVRGVPDSQRLHEQERR